MCDMEVLSNGLEHMQNNSFIDKFTKMDLREDIKKVTSLTFMDEDAKFYRLRGLSQAAKDKKMNKRIVKKPKNIHLIEDSDIDDDDCTNVIDDKVKPSFDKFGISAGIKEVNGGRNLSNEYWEEFWEKKLDEMTKSKEKITQNSPENENIKTNQSEAEESKKYIKQMDKWFRNAAIMGLVKINKISLQDLIGSNNENSSEKEKLEVLHETASNKHVMDDDKYVESVPLREDPEIYIHPLQMGIDKKKFKDIDFTPSRIGKKTIMTPQAYFIDATDDSSFEFVKRNDSTT